MQRRHRLIMYLLALLPLLYAGKLIAVDDVANIPGYTGVFTGDLPDMRKRKLIRALVTYSPSDFFFYQGQTKGIQVEFLNAYVKFLNRGVKREEKRVHVTFIPVTFNELIPALKAGRGDIAADFLTITPQREKQVAFVSGGDWRIDELVVSHRSVDALSHIDDLAGREVYVLNGSSYAEHLKALNRQFRKRGLQPVKIVEADRHLLSEDLLEMVNAGTVSITVVDDYIARLWQQLLPDIRVHEELATARGNAVGWAIRDSNPHLQKSLEAFARTARKGTLLGNMLFKRYYQNTRWLENATSAQAMQKVDELIPLFEKYGSRYGFDSWALVGQAYQESGLDHDRRSHRGAVGIMQVLPSTAGDRNVNIRNINKLENNIHAATKYLAFLRSRYFSDPAITPQNQLAFTWAAYNAGPANVRRMRDKARQMGLDENVWFGNVEIAASKLVGREPVRYVAHVYKYYVAYKLADEAAAGKANAVDRLQKL